MAWHKSQRTPACTLEPEKSEPTASESATASPVEDLGFNWSRDKDAVILEHQPAIAVYWNDAGGLTIRQEREWNEEEDHVVHIGRDNIDAFIDKLTDICGIPSVGK